VIIIIIIIVIHGIADGIAIDRSIKNDVGRTSLKEGVWKHCLHGIRFNE